MQRIKYLLILSLIALFAYSCEYIPPAERWQDITALESSNISMVLIEDYTGQECVNCPSAAKTIRNIVKAFAGNAIVVSMHSPRTGMTTSELASEECDRYAEAYGHRKVLPGVMINRKTVEGESKYSLNMAIWPSLILKQILTEPKYNLDLTASYVADEKKIKANVNVKSSDSSPLTKLGLQLWLVEDIKTIQLLPSGYKKDYFHHNVFRSSLNGTWGVECPASGEYSLVADVPENVVNIDNAKVMAYVFDTESKEILTSTILALGNGIKPEEDEEETFEPNVPTLNSNTLWFSLGDKTYRSGEQIVIETNANEVDPETDPDLMTPPIYIYPGTEYGIGDYNMLVEKLDNKEDLDHGLWMVCICGHCYQRNDKNVFENEAKILYTEKNRDQALQIHYSIKKKDINLKKDYKIRVNFSKNGNVISTIYIVLRNKIK